MFHKIIYSDFLLVFFDKNDIMIGDVKLIHVVSYTSGENKHNYFADIKSLNLIIEIKSIRTYKKHYTRNIFKKCMY